jgi:hypothetical protein
MTTKALTNDGRNAIRDFLQSDLDDMAVGTDGTDPSATDTALGNEVLRKAFKSEKDTGDGSGQYDMRVLSTEANGSALRELGLYTGGGALYARIAFAEINKTSDFEVEFEVTATVQNP